MARLGDGSRIYDEKLRKRLCDPKFPPEGPSVLLPKYTLRCIREWYWSKRTTASAKRLYVVALFFEEQRKPKGHFTNFIPKLAWTAGHTTRNERLDICHDTSWNSKALCIDELLTRSNIVMKTGTDGSPRRQRYHFVLRHYLPLTTPCPYLCAGAARIRPSNRLSS